MKQSARIVRNNVPYTLLSNGTLYGEPLHVPSVTAARLLPDPPPPAISIGSAGESVTGTYYWDSASTAADDGQTVIKVTAITTGRYKPVSVAIGGSGSFLSVATPTALKAVNSASLTDTQPASIQSPGSNWVWSASTGAGFESDDVTIIRPTSVLLGSNGRWYNTSASPVVTTYAAARLAVSGQQPTISVQARSALNDGGGGIFDYDSTDTSSSDDGALILVAGTRRYKRRFSGPVDVRWFGAKSDGELVSSITTTNGSASITLAGRTSADIGKLISIEAAGPGGESLVTTISNVSGSTVTLATTASHTGGSKHGAIATDNTDAINAWLNYRGNAAQTGNGYVPDGAFGYLGPLDTLPAGYTIQGNGPSSELWYFGDSRAMVIANAQHTGDIAYSGANRIDKLRLVSMNSASEIGLDINEVYDIDVGAMHVYGRPDDTNYSTGFTDAGIRVTSALTGDANAADVTFRACVVHGCRGSGGEVFTTAPAAAGSRMINIIGGRYQGNARYGWEIPENGSANVNWFGADIEGNTLGSIRIEQGHNCTARGCHFEVINVIPITLGATGAECGAIMFEGNTFSLTGASAQYCIDVEGGTGLTGLVVKGNKFVSQSNHGKSILRMSAGCTGVEVANNSPIGSSTGGFTPNAGHTREVEDVNYLSSYKSVDNDTTTRQVLGSTGGGAVDFYGQRLVNRLAAANGAQQWSPLLTFEGRGWKTTATAASKSVEALLGLRTVQGTTTPHGYLAIKLQIDGAGWVGGPEFWDEGNVALGPNGSRATFCGLGNTVWFPTSDVADVSVAGGGTDYLFAYPTTGWMAWNDANQGFRLVNENGMVTALAPVGNVQPINAFGELGGVKRCSGDVRTTDATQTTLYTEPGNHNFRMRSRASYDLRVTVLGRDTTTFELIRYRRLIAVKSNQVSATIVQTDTIGTDVDEVGVGGVAFDITNNTEFRVRVTGLADTTIDWSVMIEGDILWSTA